MSHYTTLRDKKHEGRFFSMYHSHFTDVLITDRRFSHGPIIVPLNVTRIWIGSDQTTGTDVVKVQNKGCIYIHPQTSHSLLTISCLPLINEFIM